MDLFLKVKFIYSIIKMLFQKKEKPRRRRFANFKKICIWGLGEHQQARKGISLSPACNQCKNTFIYRFLAIPIITNLFYELEKMLKKILLFHQKNKICILKQNFSNSYVILVSFIKSVFFFLYFSTNHKNI